MDERRWMRRAAELSERGRGRVEPNPRVGAVVLDRSGRRCGEGYHARFGGPHAEVAALRKAGARSRGGTLFVTLEPCSTHGKTPPCTDAVIRSGLKRVVVGMRDPNPRHRGRGLRLLRQAGIRVKSGVLMREIRRQNGEFVKWMTTGLPWVSLKMAESLDGKIATSTGKSRWITSLGSRRRVGLLRAQHEAVLVGSGTLMADRPSLRLKNLKGRNPRRIFIMEDPAKIRGYLKRTGKKGDLLFSSRPPEFRMRGVECIRAPFRKGRVSPGFVLSRIGRAGISSLLVEGGGEMAASFLEGGWVDRVYFFIAPLLIGGRGAKTGFEGRGSRTLGRAIRLKDVSFEKIGPDLLVTGLIRKGD